MLNAPKPVHINVSGDGTAGSGVDGSAGAGTPAGLVPQHL